MGRGNRRTSGRSARAGVSRRDFLTTAGLGAVGVATAGAAAAPPLEQPKVASEVAPGEMVAVELTINDLPHQLLVQPRWSLAWVLREQLGMTGTKLGCDRGECGACTVLIDNVPRYACLTLAVEAQETAITTLEGLLEGEQLGAVQQAFVEHDGFQCGYCTPGQILAVEGLLRDNPAPSLDEIRTAVSGNLCRCGAYVNIFKAARRAAELKSGSEERT